MRRAGVGKHAFSLNERRRYQMVLWQVWSRRLTRDIMERTPPHHSPYHTTTSHALHGKQVLVRV
jgi:hypothetical protein